MLIRPARADEGHIILDLIDGLAEYEKCPEEAVVTLEQINNSFFCDNPSVFCNFVEVDGEVVGFAVWFLNYSTWTGTNGIYIEDLFVKPDYRGEGYGKALLSHLAKICIDRGYHRLQWWVLNWNEPSINFYKSLGAVDMDEWTVMRVSDSALSRLASLDTREV
jgi:GNAT superfamily N-acetyltransferase